MFLTFVATCTLLTLVASMQCVPSSHTKPYLQFCSAINYDVNGPTPDQSHYIDQLAKQTFVQTMHMHASCGGKVLSKQCNIAFRKYACAYHFPKCVNATTTTPTHLKPPCREVCEHYCDVCNMAGCPCLDLPLRAADGESTCQTLEDLCPSCIGDLGTEGVCTIAAQEALAMGIPVDISKASDWPEIDEYRAGISVDTNPDSVHNALKKLLSDKESLKEYGNNARKLIQKKFQLNNLIKKYQSMYEKALKNNLT